MKNTIKFSKGIFSATVSEPSGGFGFRVNVYKSGSLIGPEWLETKVEALDYAQETIRQLHEDHQDQQEQTAIESGMSLWIPEGV